MKHAVVIPIIKKGSQDSTQLKSYRPVSNLPLLAKLLKKVVQGQLQCYLTENNAMPQHPSAYRQYHSTKTALIKITNDLLQAADHGLVSPLCMVDLTAAFDTIDHSLLLSRLQGRFGVEGICLAWFVSSLSERTYCVVVDGLSSRIIHIICSVPQGSVLGPLLFILYMAELADIAAQYEITLHTFADDDQLYVHCEPQQVLASAYKVEQCVEALAQWMAANRIKLNAAKTELMWSGMKNNLLKIPGGSGGLQLTLAGDHIAASSVVHVLGVLLTSDMSMDKHAAAVSAKCFFQLWQLRRIRRSLDDNAVATLVHAFVASRVDYCGSLFVGTPKKTTDKLQRVFNAAVRLVSNTRKYNRGLTHIRRNVLHWLDVTDRVRFRVCVQMFKCLHGIALDYLSTMCHPASRLPGRQNLRSANRGQLDVPRATLSSCGVRAFAHAGPSLWNNYITLHYSTFFNVA